MQALWKTALDPRIGIIHATTNRNFSLNLDFADLFKPVIVDKVIFSLVNLLQLQLPLHFEEKESGAVYLNKEGKRIYLQWNGINFGSDSIITSFRYDKGLMGGLKKVIPDFKKYMEIFIHKSYN